MTTLDKDVAENVKSNFCGWTKVYHLSGLQVTLPVPIEPKEAFSHVGLLLETGWSACT